ncbi:hypothetical protein BBF96_13405 [Anoxybacter fermentans]|uniref:Uncharacterized protein n=1 Tax=Anoxybacter fermentans TaxID=1323375 RepID=A0A3Q9HSL6_9FIRM|nr:hypothetical protein [Anoxybacter fermentans]AZR74310.1 hypothetical protein BBF96_13405 [Anoxybacter fermentans]
MSRVELSIIGVFVGVMCPLSLFVFGWWLVALLSVYNILNISDNVIVGIAFAGLGVGIILDILGLKNLISRFYTLELRWLVLVYIFWSCIAVAFFMGLPFGNIVLGIIAGVYIGRKHYYAGTSKDLFAMSARYVGIFAALITGILASAIGFMALNDRYTLRMIYSSVGLKPSSITDVANAILVGMGCVVLVVLQFWCTKFAAMFAFRLGKRVT